MTLDLRYDANIVNEEKGLAFVRLSFRMVDGDRTSIEVPRRMTLDPSAIHKELADHNADLSGTIDPRAEIARVLTDPPAAQFVVAKRMGWRDGEEVYVCHFEVFRAPDRSGAETLLPPKLDVLARTSLAGSLEEWKRLVVAPCLKSSVATLCLCAAFGAPLLQFMGRPTFGLNLFADGKSGKSTAELAAASVYGFSEERHLPNWGGTAAAIAEQCRAFNDGLLVLNEVGLIAGRKAKIHEYLRHISFAISEGRDRDRHSLSEYSSASSVSAHRLIFLSTSEHSIADYARAAGTRRDPGEIARFPDVPAVRPGSICIFDEISDPREAEKLFAMVRKGCLQNHGTAIGPYIQYLLQDVGATRRAVDHCVRWFEKCAIAKHPELSAPLRHALSNWAILFAGGCLAVDAGVLHTTHEFIGTKLLRLFRSMVDANEDEDKVLQSAERELLAHAKTLPRNRRLSQKDEAIGYVTTNEDGVVVTYHATKLRKLYARRPGVLEALLARFEKQGRIVRNDSADHDFKRAPLTHGDPVRWPGGPMMRSVRIRFPRKRSAD